MSPLVLLALLALARADIGESLARAADGDLPEAARLAAFEALVAEGYGPDLIRLAEDPTADARHRYVAVRAIGRIDSPPGRDALVRLLKDPVSGLRAAAATALGEVHGTEHTPAIAFLLDDQATIVRGAAADALAAIGDERAVPALESALQDPDNFYRGQSLWVRRHFVDALGATGSRAALPALLRCIEDADTGVVDAALAALERVSGVSWSDGRSREQQVAAWQRWAESQR